MLLCKYGIHRDTCNEGNIIYRGDKQTHAGSHFPHVAEDVIYQPCGLFEYLAQRGEVMPMNHLMSTFSLDSLTCHSQRVQTLLAESFICAGPRLFKCLPRDIQDTTGANTETLKKRLNKFLGKISDELPVPHTAPPPSANCNP